MQAEVAGARLAGSVFRILLQFLFGSNKERNFFSSSGFKSRCTSMDAALGSWIVVRQDSRRTASTAEAQVLTAFTCHSAIYCCLAGPIATPSWPVHLLVDAATYMQQRRQSTCQFEMRISAETVLAQTAKRSELQCTMSVRLPGAFAPPIDSPSADHPPPIYVSSAEEPPHASSSSSSSSLFDCHICLEQASLPVVTSCGHL